MVRVVVASSHTLRLTFISATTHIKYLGMAQQQSPTRLNQAEMEMQRLRSYVTGLVLSHERSLTYLRCRLNEALMLSTAERHAPIPVVQAQDFSFCFHSIAFALGLSSRGNSPSSL